jgi:hypothetical protein
MGLEVVADPGDAVGAKVVVSAEAELSAVNVSDLGLARVAGEGSQLAMLTSKRSQRDEDHFGGLGVRKEGTVGGVDTAVKEDVGV